MNFISMILKNIRNLFPYFLLIAIYFFFINLEAKKEKIINNKYENEKSLQKQKSIEENKQIRIEIPVIPYQQ